MFLVQWRKYNTIVKILQWQEERKRKKAEEDAKRKEERERKRREQEEMIKNMRKPNFVISKRDGELKSGGVSVRLCSYWNYFSQLIVIKIDKNLNRMHIENCCKI